MSLGLTAGGAFPARAATPAANRAEASPQGPKGKALTHHTRGE